MWRTLSADLVFVKAEVIQGRKLLSASVLWKSWSEAILVYVETTLFMCVNSVL